MSSLRPIDRLANLLAIEPGEGSPVAWMMALAVAVGVARMLVYTGAYALFLAQHDVAVLPWVYMGVAALAAGASGLYLRAATRLPLRLLLPGTFFVLAGLVLGARVALALPLGSAVAFALPVLYELLYTLSYLAFWALAGRVFHLRQGKRLFGLLGTGDRYAEILLGFSMPLLVGRLGAQNLLLLGGVAVLVALAICLRALRFVAREGDASGADDPSPTPPQGLFRGRYVRLLIVQILLTWVAWYSVDLIFFGRLSEAVTDPDATAAFLGVFEGAVAALSLFGQALLTPRILGRLGVPNTLLVLPLTLLLSLAALVTAALLGAGPWGILAAAAVARACAVLFTGVTDAPATLLLFQPLPADRRLRVQGLADGVVYPLAVGAAGALLLVLQGLGLPWQRIAAVVLVLIGLWLVTAVLLGREYPRKIADGLARRLIDSNEALAQDPASLAALERALGSPSLRQARYALSMLEELAPERLAAQLPALLDRPELRLDALQAAERRGLDAGAEALLEDGDPAVVAAALRAVCATAAKPVEQAAPWLRNPSGEVRRAALVSLLRFGDLDGLHTASPHLVRLQGSDDDDDQLELAQVLADAALPTLHGSLGGLLRVDRPDLFAHAARAAAHAPHPDLLAPLLAGLDHAATRASAAEALVAWGPAAVPAVRDALLQLQVPAPTRTLRLVRLAGDLEANGVTDTLRGGFDHPDADVQTAAVAAVLRQGRRPGPATRAATQGVIDALAVRALRVARATDELGSIEPPALRVRLGVALTEEAELVAGRLLAALELLHGSRLRRVRAGLLWGDLERRALALESLDGLLGRRGRGLVAALDPGLSPGRKIAALAEGIDLPPLGAADRLREMATDPVAWPTPWLRELAALAHEGPLPAPLIPPTHDNPPPPPEDRPMLTIEKVAALKATDVFAETPDRVLASLTRIAKDKTLAPAQQFITQGALENDMFVIVDGEVEVRVGDRPAAVLGAGTVVGEMQLLDPGPRSADVVARTEAVVLRIGKEHFDELSEDQPEIARAMNRMLVRRLRAATAER